MIKKKRRNSEGIVNVVHVEFEERIVMCPKMETRSRHGADNQTRVNFKYYLS